MEQVPRKGLSKGCLVGLIIGGALLVIVIIIFVLAIIYREEFLKMGTKATMNMIKAELISKPLPEVDTVRFDALTDNFVAKINADSIDFIKYQQFIPLVQEAMKDKKIDKSEVQNLADAMVRYYPDLSEMAKDIVKDSSAVAPLSDTVKPNDTLQPVK